MLEFAESTLVTFNPKSVSPETRVDRLQQIMDEIQVRHLPVIDAGRRIVGMVSDHDVADAYFQAARGGAQAAAEVGAKRVEEIMTRQVVTLEQYESPEIALKAMVAHGFHSTPITQDGELAGMITSSDFLREFSYGDWSGHDEPVSNCMTGPGQTIDGDEPLARALETAEQCGQQFVVVVRNGRPLGILSRTALRQCLCLPTAETEAGSRGLHDVPTYRLLSPLPALSPEMPLGQAASKMLEYRARALPVTDRSRTLLGILREDDILRTMAEQMEN